ncbi:NUMOD4 domain-containing protein [Flavobacterium sp. N3904]|uniref:NUMOD4 domain-containing protein n=1 Tax=Flavobacterium sp. N3904 TaxID=2986835 RepID=UPI0022248153|nr:NUMOD4 domain-containing protein [Flavobacterium sp. N3904]
MPQIRIYPNEQFKEIQLDYSLKLRYAISNKGRLISFSENIEDCRLLKGSLSDGYPTFSFRIKKDGKTVSKCLFLYKLVAQYFIPKQSEEQTYVLHLDYSRNNDDVNNLRWATRAEMIDHRNKSPNIIQARKNLIEHNLKADGRKLTTIRVMLIKKILARPEQKTRLKMIAKQFGVSEMQIRRIATGENWGHVKI